jgi:hypothetical protein
VVSTRSAEKESIPEIVSYGALEVNRGTAVGLGLGAGDGAGDQVELGKGIGVTVAVGSGESVMGGGGVAANVGVGAEVSAVDVITVAVQLAVAVLIAVTVPPDAASLVDATVGATSVGEAMPTPDEPQAASKRIINDSTPYETAVLCGRTDTPMRRCARSRTTGTRHARRIGTSLVTPSPPTGGPRA